MYRLMQLAMCFVVVIGLSHPAYGVFPETDVFVASAGNGPGAGDSHWYTTLWIHNPGDDPADCRIQLLVRGQSNTSPPTYNVTVAAGEVMRFDRAVESLFGLEAFGAIRVTSNEWVVVNSRIYNQPGSDPSNTQGQAFAAVPASFAIGTGDQTEVVGVNQAGDNSFRYNFGFVETAGGTATLSVTLRDGTGSELGQSAYTLRPYEAYQGNLSELGAGSSPTGNGALEVRVAGGDGKVIAFGSGIANASDDPSTFTMRYAHDLLGTNGGGISSVTAGDGLAGGGSSGDVALDVGAGDGLDVTADAVRLADGGVTQSKLAAGSATSGQVLGTDGSSLAWVDAGAFTLPLTQTANTGSTTAFVITNQGDAPVAFFGLENENSDKAALAALTLGSGVGVSGVASEPQKGGVGVDGFGDLHGVSGEGVTGYGVRGISHQQPGVVGFSPGAAGVDPLSGTPLTNSGTAGISVGGPGVIGFSQIDTFGGVEGHNREADGVGVYAAVEGSGGVAVEAMAFGAADEAGFFGGDVEVAGTLTKSGGSFVIDHPLHPDEMYLAHSFVESPDMMNIYNGNVVLGPEGTAVVELPEWFEELNRDFRYQLTCIGGHAPVYVAEPIADNRFTIAGGTPGLTVSWQVTGVRHDPWADENRIRVEWEKTGDDRGRYLDPELYGQPSALGIHSPSPERLRALGQTAGDSGQ